MQCEDLDVRTRFLIGAEALQLYLELCCQPAAAAERWRTVGHAIIARPPGADDEAHWAAVFNMLTLTEQERAAFRCVGCVGWEWNWIGCDGLDASLSAAILTL
jgi:hypothetical protein